MWATLAFAVLRALVLNWGFPDPSGSETTFLKVRICVIVGCTFFQTNQDFWNLASAITQKNNIQPNYFSSRHLFNKLNLEMHTLLFSASCCDRVVSGFWSPNAKCKAWAWHLFFMPDSGLNARFTKWVKICTSAKYWGYSKIMWLVNNSQLIIFYWIYNQLDSFNSNWWHKRIPQCENFCVQVWNVLTIVSLNPSQLKKNGLTYNSVLHLPRWRWLVMWLNVCGVIVATSLLDITSLKFLVFNNEKLPEIEYKSHIYSSVLYNSIFVRIWIFLSNKKNMYIGMVWTLKMVCAWFWLIVCQVMSRQF